ncbi:hypothetical protein D3C86_1795360 [compost metagenome]
MTMDTGPAVLLMLQVGGKLRTILAGYLNQPLIMRTAQQCAVRRIRLDLIQPASVEGQLRH